MFSHKQVNIGKLELELTTTPQRPTEKNKFAEIIIALS